jgi:ATP dependent DNA ligase domain
MLYRVPVGFIESCLPISVAKPPVSPNWIHEIKHDGFRMFVRRDAAGVRLFTRKGNDWTGRFPLIANAAAALQRYAGMEGRSQMAFDWHRIWPPRRENAIIWACAIGLVVLIVLGVLFLPT